MLPALTRTWPSEPRYLAFIGDSAFIQILATTKIISASGRSFHSEIVVYGSNPFQYNWTIK